MLSKMYYYAQIMDVTNEGCTDLERDALLEFFKLAMKHAASVGIRKGWFDVQDFYIPGDCDIKDFGLLIKKQDLDEIEGLDEWDVLWHGRFKCDKKDKKLLRVDGMLIKDYR